MRNDRFVTPFAAAAVYICAALLCLSGPARGEDNAPKAPPATAPGAPATTNPAGGPAKFYGTVSAVDTKAMTFTVDNQTFHIVGESHMTKAADDAAATLADAVVGEPARGSYTKSADGALNI